MVDVDDSCQFSADSQPKSIGLVWGLAATRRSVYIHQMNQVNSRNDFGHDDSTINIVMAIIIIIIISNTGPGKYRAKPWGQPLEFLLLPYPFHISRKWRHPYPTFSHSIPRLRAPPAVNQSINASNRFRQRR